MYLLIIIMKKFWKIIGIIFRILLVLFIILLIGLFIFLENFDAAKYKPQIIQMASQALGRQVDFKDIDFKVSLNEGVRFYLSDFSIGENPDFGSGAFVSAGEITAGLDIFSFLAARQISIPNILIRSPRVNIIRNPKGVFNAQTLGKSSQGLPAKGKSSPMNIAAFPAFLIKSFKIENAEVYFIDKSVQPGQKIAVTQLNLGVRNFSPINSFDISLDAAVLSAQTDLRVNGKIQLNLSKNEAKFTDTDVSIDLNQLPLDALKALALFKGIPVPQELNGQLKAKIKEAVVSDKGLNNLIIDVSLIGGEIVAPDIAPGISLEAKHLDFSIGNFSLNSSGPFQVNLMGAFYQEQINVTFNSDVFFDPKTLGIRLAKGQFITNLSLWPLEKIKSSVAPLKNSVLPEHMSGKLEIIIKGLQAQSTGIKTALLGLNLSEGEVILKGVLPGASLALNKTNLTVTDFSLTQPFAVSFETAYLSEDPDIFFDGNVSYDFNTQSAFIKDAVFSLDLDRFSLDRFKSSGLAPVNLPLPRALGGNLKARINNLSVSAKGLKRMNADIGWQNGKFSIQEAAPGISVTAHNINLNLKGFSLENAFDINASLGYESDEPNIFFSAKAAFNPLKQNVFLSKINIKTDLSKIPFERLKTTITPLKTVSLPETLKGQLDVFVNEFSAGPKGIMAVTADLVLKNGEVSFKELAPGVSFAASRINAEIKNFGLGIPFGFNIGLAYLHNQPNIKVKGTAALRMEDQSIMIKDTVFETDLSTFAIDQLKSSIAVLEGVSLPEKLEGKFNIEIAEAIATAKGLSRLTSRGSLKAGAVKLKELALAIQGLNTNFSLADKDFTMDTIQASLGKGRITGRLGIKDYIGLQDFKLSAEIKGIDLVEVLDQAKAPVKVEGLVFGNFNAQGQGADINSINGDGNFEVKEARLKDFNVLKELLNKISFFPNVSSRIESSLTGKYKEKLGNKDTEIKKISALCVISKGLIFIDPVSIEADEFIFSGKSQAGFDQKYSLDGAFKIPEELSLAMASGVSEMRYLFDENNNISLPVHITGQGSQTPVISLAQTAIDIGKNVLRNEGKKELEKVLNKALGVGQQSNPADSQSQYPAEPSQGQNSPASEIINNIFKKVFK